MGHDPAFSAEGAAIIRRLSKTGYGGETEFRGLAWLLQVDILMIHARVLTAPLHEDGPWFRKTSGSTYLSGPHRSPDTKGEHAVTLPEMVVLLRRPAPPIPVLYLGGHFNGLISPRHHEYKTRLPSWLLEAHTGAAYTLTHLSFTLTRWYSYHICV